MYMYVSSLILREADPSDARRNVAPLSLIDAAPLIRQDAYNICLTHELINCGRKLLNRSRQDFAGDPDPVMA